MPIKIIADSKAELPEHLQSEAKEVDGKYEISGDGIIKKNTELLGKNAKLQTRAEEAEAAKEASDAAAKEWKGKAGIPAGQKLVPDEIAELGEAAKTAEISKDEMPTLKTAKADLQKQINEMSGERVQDEVADALGWKRGEFKRLAKGLNIVAEDVKEGSETKKKFFVVSTDSENKETKTDVIEDANFKPFIASLQQEPGRRYIGQESGKEGEGMNEYDRIAAEVKAEQKAITPGSRTSVLAALSGNAVTTT